MKLFALALLVSACATPACYPKIQIHHQGMKATGAYAGVACATEGVL